MQALPTEDLDALVAEVMGDFRAFCSLLECRLPTGGFQPFHWETWFYEQQQLDKNRTGRDIVLKPRQVGISTEELARDLWFAIVNRGVNVLVIAHESELAEQLFLNLKLFAENLKALGLLPKTRYSSKRELVFADTGSAVRIIEAGETDRAASKKGRSGTVHRLHATELAFWGAAGETMAAVLSSVHAGGEVVIESTANGAGGLFYEDVKAAREGRSGYKLHFFAWYQHKEYRKPLPPGFDAAPRDAWEKKLREHGCDDEQIAWWRSKVDDPKVGLEKALQEYPVDVESCFRVAGNAWIDASLIDALIAKTRAPIATRPLTFKSRYFGDANVFTNPRGGAQYVVFGDVSEGVARDASSAHVLDRRTGDTVATFWSDRIEPGDFGLVLAVLGWLYNTAEVGAERNNNGHATLRALAVEAEYPTIFHHEDGRPGWLTNPATRPVLFEDLHLAIREGAVTTPDLETVSEAKTLIRDEDGKPRARGKKAGNKDACRDDRFVSWAGAWQMRSRGGVWNPGSINVRNL